VLDIDGCLLQSDRNERSPCGGARLFAERGLSVYEQDTGEGLLRFLMLREGPADRRADDQRGDLGARVSELAPLVERLQARDAGTTSVVMNVNPKKASVAVRGGRALLGRADPNPRAGGRPDLPGLGQLLLQTNTRQAERLFDLVVESTGLTAPRPCSTCTRAPGRSACCWLAGRAGSTGWSWPGRGGRRGGERAANSITNCTFLSGEVALRLPELIAKGVTAEVVVADPPARVPSKALHA